MPRLPEHERVVLTVAMVDEMERRASIHWVLADHLRHTIRAKDAEARRWRRLARLLLPAPRRRLSFVSKQTKTS